MLEPFHLEQIKQHTTESLQHNYTLMLVPRRTVLCDKILEEEGVFGEVRLGHCEQYEKHYTALTFDITGNY
jgi:hypothetical protein